MANTIAAWVYTDRLNRNYITGVNSEVAAQDDGGSPAVPLIGGRAATSADSYPPLPSSVKPRRVHLKNTAKKSRYLTVMSADAPLASSTPPTIDIEDSDGAASTYTVRKLLPEDFGRSRV
jgi:hypothetical protein